VRVYKIKMNSSISNLTIPQILTEESQAKIYSVPAGLSSSKANESTKFQPSSTNKRNLFRKMGPPTPEAILSPSPERRNRAPLRTGQHLNGGTRPSS